MLSQERDVIANGSKSFYLASLFFSKPVKEGAWKLYRWCRHCDDQIDFASSKAEAHSRLAELFKKTALAATSHAQAVSEPEFEALRSLCVQYKIPLEYPRDLIQGFEMDVHGRTYDSLEDIELYAYHVAGVVGLMMTHIFGTSSIQATKHAVHMGIAMQLTNISRDIHEDYTLGRVYLPQSWLQELGIASTEICKPENRQKLQQLTERLLKRADELYRSGYEGLRYLPLRAALAVSIAGSIYSFIGKKVLKARNFEKRVYVTLPEKILLSIAGTFRVLPIAIERTVKPWKPVPAFDLRSTR